MRAVLISIQPTWCELIASGKKTVEVRKSRPKLETPFKVYIYETQGRTETPFVDEEGHHIFKGRGKVIGEFVCDKIIHISCKDLFENFRRLTKNIITPSCLKVEELKKYMGYYDGYGWRISELKIYDEPKELYDFINYNKHEVCLKKNCFSGDCWGCPNNAIMVFPPQSWCYVKSEGAE